MRTLSLISMLIMVTGCGDTSLLVLCTDDAVIEIATVTLGDDGVHEQGEQCYIVSATGEIDYTECCPTGWDFLALGGEGGILCEWAEETCPAVVEVAGYSDLDGTTTPAHQCPVFESDSTDYNGCCPDTYDPIGLGPDLDTIICQELP